MKGFLGVLFLLAGCGVCVAHSSHTSPSHDYDRSHSGEEFLWPEPEVGTGIDPGFFITPESYEPMEIPPGFFVFPEEPINEMIISPRFFADHEDWQAPPYEEHPAAELIPGVYRDDEPTHKIGHENSLYPPDIADGPVMDATKFWQQAGGREETEKAIKKGIFDSAQFSYLSSEDQALLKAQVEEGMVKELNYYFGRIKEEHMEDFHTKGQWQAYVQNLIDMFSDGVIEDFKQAQANKP